MENIKNLFQLYFRPAFAMSEIIDKGSWLFAAVLMLLVSLVFFVTVNTRLQAVYNIPSFNSFYHPNRMINEDSLEAEAEFRRAEAEYRKALDARQKIPLVGDTFFKFFSFEPNKFYQPLLSLSIFYVPLTILLMCLVAGVGSFGMILRRDYGVLSICSLMAYAAAHLPFAIIGILLYSQNVPPEIYLLMWIAGGLMFGLLMVFALRTVFGVNYGPAILTVCLSWLAFSLGMYVFQYISPWLFSPFLLIYGYMYLGGEVRNLGGAFRQRQDFRRFLNSAAINPNDADAQIQLALIYLQRRQEAKALEHLNRAIEIDPNEIDANYELGKIARAKGDLQKALDHFAIVVEQNDKYALSEIWREIGATYLEANMLTEARADLEKYVERRAVDAEGLYYLGRVLKAQGETARAGEMFEQSIEAARTAPSHRRYDQKKWANLSQKQLS